MQLGSQAPHADQRGDAQPRAGQSGEQNRKQKKKRYRVLASAVLDTLLVP